MKGEAIRGLATFISDIRNCKSREAELKRINKELANIRSKFKGDKPLDGYQKKKYVCKLLFIFLLGHEIDFGHMEAVNLLSSNRYSEKQIGYLFISVLVSPESDLMKLIIQAIRADLRSHNPVFTHLALSCLANLAGREMVEAFGEELTKHLLSGETMDTVKQSLALTMLSFLRTTTDVVPMGESSARLIHLLNDQHMGVVTAASSLIEQLARRNPDEMKGCVPIAISRLSRIVTSSYTDMQDYTYYFVPCPWLSVRLLRLLQNFQPPEDPSLRARLNECLEAILNRAGESPKSKKVQHSNARNCVLFEAINLIIHLDTEPNLLIRASNLLGQFLQHRETNLRYLALEGLCLLATSEYAHESVKKHIDTVIAALKSEKDVSVRQRAVDLLYAMCDKSNAEQIVGEMLAYLESADYAIREEMVLKIAILAEKYATEYTWYVDTILHLIRVAGDYVSDEVWYRVVQIIVNRDDVQHYAAQTCFEALRAPSCHENMIKVGAYVLGEFGNLIARDPNSPAEAQFRILHDRFHLCSPATRGLLLTTYIKFLNLFPELKPTLLQVLRSDNNIKGADVEIQQRAVEYLRLSELASVDLLATVLDEMPAFPERESSLLSKLKRKAGAAMGKEGRTVGKKEVTHAIKIGGESVKAKSPSKKDKEAKHTAPAPPALAASAGTAAHAAPAPAPAAALAPAADSLIGDLLGLDLNSSTPAPAFGATLNHNNVSPPNAASSGNPLEDIFSNITPAAPTASIPPSFDLGFGSGIGIGSTQTPSISAGVAQNLAKFVTKNSGVIYEDELMQIGVKSEFRQNLAKIGLYYGNKSSSSFSQFTPKLHLVAAASSEGESLTVQLKPIETGVESGQQVQQPVNVECVREFAEADVPLLELNFLHAGLPRSVVLRLPISVNKFFEPVDMNSEVFFQRWKQLSAPGQEQQRIFTAKFSQDQDAVRSKWTSFGLSNLVQVDPNAANTVGASIFYTTKGQIGVLVRLEPNLQTQQYRLTVRAVKPDVATTTVELLEPLL